jgi:hypothetical protein
MAFTRDGRLLVCSGGFTDAVLEFTQGGREVRRLIDLVPDALAVMGELLYVAGGWRGESAVHVFDDCGSLIRKIGSEVDYAYRGVAVDEAGSVYAANYHDGTVEVFRPGGGKVRVFKGLRHPRKLLLHQGVLYGIEHPGPDRWEVVMMHPGNGEVLRRIRPPRGIEIMDLTPGPQESIMLFGSEPKTDRRLNRP